MAPRVAALASAVDDLVGTPVGDLCLAELQEQIPAVARLVERLSGWVSAAAGQLDAATGGRVPTGDGGGRSVVGWLAEVNRPNRQRTHHLEQPGPALPRLTRSSGTTGRFT